MPLAGRAGSAGEVGMAATPWLRFFDEEGDAYYYNTETGENTWALPQGGFVDPPSVAAGSDAGTSALSGASSNGGSTTRLLVISAPVLMAQSQLILGAARQDVTVVLFDGSATPSDNLLALVRNAVPARGRLAMIGFMSQESPSSRVAADGGVAIELTTGSGSGQQTTRHSLRGDPSLLAFWRGLGAMVDPQAGRIDLLQSTVGVTVDGQQLLADVVRTPLAQCFSHC
eukprot:COSAG05_NODE_687_length_7922_cov_7.188035_2_plen_228_part_00